MAKTGYQNESQNYEAKKFNGLTPILGRQEYKHSLVRGDSKTGMMLIEFETSILFRFTSTVLEDDRPGLIGEVQKI